MNGWIVGRQSIRQTNNSKSKNFSALTNSSNISTFELISSLGASVDIAIYSLREER